MVKLIRKNQQGMVGLVAGLMRLFFGLILSVLALRFVFRLLGANETNGLVNWVYHASVPFVSPFFGIFNHDVYLPTGRLEFETLLAILVYGIIASLVLGVFTLGSHRHKTV